MKTGWWKLSHCVNCFDFQTISGLTPWPASTTLLFSSPRFASNPLNLQIFDCVDINILTRTSLWVSRRKPTQAWVTPRGFLRCGDVGLVNSLSHSLRRRAPGGKSPKMTKMQSRKLRSQNFKAVMWRLEEGHQYKVTKKTKHCIQEPQKKHFDLCQ